MVSLNNCSSPNLNELGFILASPSMNGARAFKGTSCESGDEAFPKGRAETFSCEVKMLLVSGRLHSWPWHFHWTTEACWALPMPLLTEYELIYSKVWISDWKVTCPGQAFRLTQKKYTWHPYQGCGETRSGTTPWRLLPFARGSKEQSHRDLKLKRGHEGCEAPKILASLHMQLFKIRRIPSGFRKYSQYNHVEFSNGNHN